MTRNERGRIVKLDNCDEHVLWPHADSECADCGMDMPHVWNAVCAGCCKILCYGCAVETARYWFCQRCARLNAESTTIASQPTAESGA